MIKQVGILFAALLLFSTCTSLEKDSPVDDQHGLVVIWERSYDTYNWSAYAPPLVINDSSLIYAGDGAIRCVTLDSGKTIWSSIFPTAGFMHKRFVLDQSRLYGFYQRDTVFAINLTDGTEAWTSIINSNREFGWVTDIDESYYYVGVNGYSNIKRILKYGKSSGELVDSIQVERMPWSVIYNRNRIYSSNGWSPPDNPNDIGRINCFSSDNFDTLWVYNTLHGGSFSLTPPVIENSILYAGTVWGGSLGNEIVALNAETGARIWRTTTTGCYQIVLHDDVLYCDLGGGILALDKSTGAHLWETHLPVADENSALAYWDGYIYNNVWGGLYIFDAESGEVVWGGLGPDKGYIYQVSAGAGKIFVQTSQHLYAFEPYSPSGN